VNGQPKLSPKPSWDQSRELSPEDIQGDMHRVHLSNNVRKAESDKGISRSSRDNGRLSGHTNNIPPAADELETVGRIVEYLLAQQIVGFRKTLLEEQRLSRVGLTGLRERLDISSFPTADCKDTRSHGGEKRLTKWGEGEFVRSTRCRPRKPNDILRNFSMKSGHEFK
jgi:hypothetical protein